MFTIVGSTIALCPIGFEKILKNSMMIDVFVRIFALLEEQFYHLRKGWLIK